MYCFCLNGVEVSCETSEELLAAISPIPTSIEVMVSGGSAPLELSAPKKRRKRRRKVELVKGDISELPLIKTKLTWDVVKKVAKKLDRTDINRLRSELFARQKMA